MKLRLLCSLLMAVTAATAQQWLDKKYNYDSTLNVTYGTAINFIGGVDTLKMDIYTPVCSDSSAQVRKPLLMWVHGGAFLEGSKDDLSITRLCKEFTKRGYVTASISYRLGFIADDTAHNCNFPNYSCVFATDEAEWARAYYRGVQDAKGAFRFLINRNTRYRIDTNNVFVAGESAGAFIALGVGLMDTAVERPSHTFLLPDVAAPSSNTHSCTYNQGLTLPGTTISRPDLGGIDGTIEPTSIRYTIKGIGNMYGGMMSNLLEFRKTGTPRPHVYSFHQPCDLIVPIDSGKIYQHLSWCFTNGYNCGGIKNVPIVYGSRAIRDWNTAGNYGYSMQNEFTGTAFPYNFLFGPGSCADQVNNPCHAYDSRSTRENNLAAFFAPLITSNQPCDTSAGIGIAETAITDFELKAYPNPVSGKLSVKLHGPLPTDILMINIHGKRFYEDQLNGRDQVQISMEAWPTGVYFLVASDAHGTKYVKTIQKL